MTHLRSPRTLRGFTVLEILVAMVISLFLLAGILTLFSNSRTSYETNDRLARIQENGRLALDMIARDVRGAGNLGCAKPNGKSLTNILNNSSDLLWNFAVPVQGFNASSTSWAPALVSPVATDRADTDGTGPDVDGPTPGNDVLVIRGPRRDTSPQVVNTNMTGTASVLVNKTAGGLKTGDIAIISSCTQASVFKVTSYTASTGTILHASGGSTAGANSSADINGQYDASASVVFPVEAVVYFVDTSTAAPAPGVIGTSLWRRAGNNNPEEVVEGVDSFQVQFGVDTNNNNLADAYRVASAVTNWNQVVAVRVALLMRSLTPYGSDTDETDRTLLGQSIPATHDHYQRLVFTTTMTLRNKVF
jgi:type IV pilus assembly protein PilW